jgi:hypothetical protein
LAFATLATVVVAGCSSPAAHNATSSATAPTSTSPPAPQAAAHGVEAPPGTVAWSDVGPGWLLAMWSPVAGAPPQGSPPPPSPPGVPTYENSTTTLYLVDPDGGRYPITTFPPGDPTSPMLTDWSGDGSRALFATSPAVNVTGATVVDLHTGTKTTVPVDGDAEFTRPDGEALLVTHYQGGGLPYKLDRFALDGTHQQSYPTDKLGSAFDGTHLSTPDGKQLVLGTSTDLILMGNDGTVGSTLPIPGQTNCGPLRWWDGETGTVVLANCSDGTSRRLWRVPIDGSTPTALTAPINLGQQTGADLGDSNAWQLPSGAFVQASGPNEAPNAICNLSYLAKLNPDGTTTPVPVPDASGVPLVIGAHDSDLDIQTSVACGSGQALLSYAPAANTSTVLLGPPVNGGGVRTAVAFPAAR